MSHCRTNGNQTFVKKKIPKNSAHLILKIDLMAKVVGLTFKISLHVHSHC